MKKISRRHFFKAVPAAAATPFLAKSANFDQKKIPLKQKPLSNSFEEMQSEYDVIVIGSGYGGSVSAARLAKGRKLCVLERGREILAGGFPQDILQGAAELYNSKDNPLGLFNFIFQKDLSALVGNGLGGTSLINANVVIEPELEIFQTNRWPKQVYKEMANGNFKDYFDRVKYVLQAESVPSTASFPKMSALEKASKDVGLNFFRPSLAVNQTKYNQTPNHMNVEQNLCNGCGNCVTGCNVGAKNTLNYNYLPLAKKNGAQIFTQIDVQYIQKVSGDKFEVHYKHHNGKQTVSSSLKAKQVIVSAGTFGSSKILMMSKKYGNLNLSNRLGYRLSGNGDFLGMGYNTSSFTNSNGFKKDQYGGQKSPVGPTIGGLTDARVSKNMYERFIIEEGAMPGAIIDLIRVISPLFSRGMSREQIQRIIKDVKNDTEKGAWNHSLVYLGIGHDEANGRVILNKSDEVTTYWKDVNQQTVYKRIPELLKNMTKKLGGRYIAPSQYLQFGDIKGIITVHPLGGCSMSENSQSGVVNQFGQAFDAEDLSSVHENLFVLDGSIMPASLGVNPLLTISAFAERACDFINS